MPSRKRGGDEFAGMSQERTADESTPPSQKRLKLQPLVAPRRRQKRGVLPDLAPQDPSSSSSRLTFPLRERVNETGHLVRRLQLGRNLPNLLSLMHTALLTADNNEGASATRSLEARQGLTARHNGQSCVIIDVFRRRGHTLVDISKLEPCEDDLLQVGALETVDGMELSDIGLAYEVVGKGDNLRKIRFRLWDGTANAKRVGNVLSGVRAVVGHVCPRAPSHKILSIDSTRAIVVESSSANSHKNKFPAHNIMQRADKQTFAFILHYPLSVCIDVTPYRCSTCDRCTDARKCKEGSAYFKVTDADVCGRFPGTFVHQTARHGKL